MAGDAAAALCAATLSKFIELSFNLSLALGGGIRNYSAPTIHLRN
jgi:hypothetical protein